MKTIAVIPAGGKGSRAGLKLPKQYVKINGKEVILYTLQKFQKNKLIDEIVISAEPEYFSLLEKLKKKHRLSKIAKIVKGGKERQDSVYAALLAINALDGDLIIVHDAARPLLNDNILSEAINTGQLKGNAVVCVKARDTLLKNVNGYEYLDRENVYYIQTPQIFKFGILMKAMQQAINNNILATDESTIVSGLGEKLNLVEGSIYNIKITTAEDVILLKKLLK